MVKTVITMTHSFKQLLISNCKQLISIVQIFSTGTYLGNCVISIRGIDATLYASVSMH